MGRASLVKRSFFSLAWLPLLLVVVENASGAYVAAVDLWHLYPPPLRKRKQT
jgi:hypothetical protein